MLGTRFSIVAISACTWLFSAALMLCAPVRMPLKLAGSIGIALVVGVIAFRAGDPVAVLLEQRLPFQPVLWREEGVQTTATINAFGPRRRSMHLDGYHQAGDDGAALGVHYTIGTLPVALHANPHDALIVGLGGGATAGAMSRYSRLNLDVVELSDTVVRASAFFNHVNFNLLAKPNVHLRLDDGRNYLASTSRHYDIITADVIQPVRAGSASLYSKEYFQLVFDRLNDDGVALQWFSGTADEYRLVARTLESVFPHVTAWGDGTLLVATKQPLQLSADDFNWKLQVPELREMFATIGIRSFDDLMAQFKAGPAELEPYVGAGMVLTDDRPVLEYFLTLPRTRELDVSALKGDPAQVLRRPDTGHATKE
jgi:spermidine synthase